MSAPKNGQLTLAADGSFVYRPAVGFSGADSFTYRAGDGKGQSAPATVALTVRAKEVEPPPPPSGRSVILGEVYDDATGLPLRDATVEFSHSDGSRAETVTDATGRYRFVTDGGEATLSIARNGYTAATRTVTITGGKIVSPLDARLVPLAAQTTVQSVVGATLHADNIHLTIPALALADDADCDLHRREWTGAARRTAPGLVASAAAGSGPGGSCL